MADIASGPAGAHRLPGDPTGDFGQGAGPVRFEWGPSGAAAVAPGAAVVVVVDVLSFTTTLTVAVERGIDVLPFPWRDPAAAAAAADRHGAVLAVGRSAAGPGQVSLSPPTVRHAPAGIRRLVLPSPNGSAISAALVAAGAVVVGVALRNARAAAAWVHREAAGRPVAVIAAGERWPDGTLRPAVEDLWGAGAFIDAYVARPAPVPPTPVPPAALTSAAPPAGAQTAAVGRVPAGVFAGAPAAPGRLHESLSPEAGTARAAYRAVATGLGDALLGCGSGRELVARGFAGDVAVASEVGASQAVPVLRGGWYVDGGFTPDSPSG